MFLRNIIFSEKVISDKLHLEFKKIKKSFLSKENQYICETIFFSQMSDWNPAEMIYQFPLIQVLFIRKLNYRQFMAQSKKSYGLSRISR